MDRTKRKYPAMPRRQRHNPFGGNPMPGMMKTVANTTMGVVGIGAMTTLGFGALNAMKPS
jgi:hypothetical protein